MTAAEIRERIISVVSENGGHLASSLGAVEIAMALADVFDPEKDRIVWDVGHQAYAWKILTGRDAEFGTIRRAGGLAPFPHPAESSADAAVSGHAGVALSVAEGYSAARELTGGGYHVVAVAGDGAIANGTSFEALNAVGAGKVIVVLNDNGMSISKPRGALSRIFAKMITGVRYNRIKASAEAVGHRLRLTPLRGWYHRIESRIKSFFLGSFYFEQFGLRYIGPVDGHDVKALKAAFTVAKEDKRSVLVHVVTVKGKGYRPAELDPTAWHGVGAFARSVSKPRDWSAAFGDAVLELARRDRRIVALTAAMKEGTGLSDFAREFPERFFDVGIAEGHMVSFAAGLAAGGMRPVVAIYSTFLQRSIDQVMHDVAISSLPVVICVDRAGAVGADGVTHQGMFDLAMLRCLPNLTICQPCDELELRAMLEEALSRNGPTVIRYPRGTLPESLAHKPYSGLAVQIASPEAETQIWASGDQLEKALAVAGRTGCGVVYARYLKPYDAELLSRQRREGRRIVSLENAAIQGGFGESIGADLKFGWPDRFMPHSEVCELEREAAFDVQSITEAING
jgi:1-deoxy-D-xylulose-5-phosphate synthase